MSWLGGLFGGTPVEEKNTVINVKPSPVLTLKPRNILPPFTRSIPPQSTPVQGATAPRDPSPIQMEVRREYVALGGSRKSGKGRKSKKSRKGKSKKSSKSKSSKSRK